MNSVRVELTEDGNHNRAIIQAAIDAGADEVIIPAGRPWPITGDLVGRNGVSIRGGEKPWTVERMGSDLTDTLTDTASPKE